MRDMMLGAKIHSMGMERGGEVIRQGRTADRYEGRTHTPERGKGMERGASAEDDKRRFKERVEVCARM
jgi:hypothetical protein